MFIRAADAASAGSPSLPLVRLFNAIQIISIILLVATLAAAYFSPLARRSATWFNFLGAWLVTSISFILTMRYQIGPEAGFGLCLFQSALIYAAPVLSSFSAVAFSIESYLVATRTLRHSKIPRRYIIVLLAVPYLGHLALFLGVLVVGLKSPYLVQRHETAMYCHVTTETPPRIAGSLVALAVILAFIMIGYTGRALHRNWQMSDPRTDMSREMCLLKSTLRFALFCLFPMTGVTMYLAQFQNSSASSDSIWVLIISSLPFWASIVFGLAESDITDAWRFWQKNRGEHYPEALELDVKAVSDKARYSSAGLEHSEASWRAS
ncbi:hypothetical protein HGRIS_000445 [Hohenbuehelia grisea]|uniref:Uncharacterized protein n=1 Tax=Hohenbuehelia grisea TaxID=104357 RepID=A0ABR3JRZ6_9AGAR